MVAAEPPLVPEGTQAPPHEPNEDGLDGGKQRIDSNRRIHAGD